MIAQRASGGRGTRGFDLAVLGAGSAGFSAAIAAAEQGAEVALVGHGAIGGTCVNVGCVPSKTMIRAMEAVHGARAAGRFRGLSGAADIAEWRAVVASKDELVATLRQTKYVDLLSVYEGVTYVEGVARLDGTGVRVDGDRLDAGKVVVATGASPAVPDIPGVADVPCLTSTTALELTELPRSLLVVGAGYVGCELAQMLARAGVAVTLVTRGRLLPAAEPEVSEVLSDCFRDEGIDVRAGRACRGIARTADGIAATVETGGATEIVEAERVLLATGRSPNTAGLGLEEAGIRLTPSRGIAVDERMRTTRAGVYAAGDVTGRDPFVYMAAHGARIAALNALDGDRLSYDDAAIPWVAFTDPHAAGVGHTERSARAAALEVETRVLALDRVPRALAARDTRGLVKLVAEAGTGRLLGAHLLAPEGGDSIQSAALAIRHRMTVREIGATIFPYLTTVEGLKLAAQTFERDVTRLSCCAG